MRFECAVRFDLSRRARGAPLIGWVLFASWHRSIGAAAQRRLSPFHNGDGFIDPVCRQGIEALSNRSQRCGGRGCLLRRRQARRSDPLDEIGRRFCHARFV